MFEIDGVICDMDGTLVDSEEQHLDAWNILLERYGHQPPWPKWNEDCIGLPDVYARDKTLRLFPDLEHVGDILEMKQQIFRDLVKSRGDGLVYPGVKQRLLSLREKGVAIAVGTNSVLVNTKATLQAAGLWDCFSTVVTADMVARGKPDPDIYIEAAARLGAAPSRCLVLEDSVAGLEAGRGAGCVVAGITNTWAREKLVPADLIFADTATALDWALEQTAERGMRRA